jgi:hypothetical protein
MDALMKIAVKLLMKKLAARVAGRLEDGGDKEIVDEAETRKDSSTDDATT